MPCVISTCVMKSPVVPGEREVQSSSASCVISSSVASAVTYVRPRAVMTPVVLYVVRVVRVVVRDAVRDLLVRDVVVHA